MNWKLSSTNNFICIWRLNPPDDAVRRLRSEELLSALLIRGFGGRFRSMRRVIIPLQCPQVVDEIPSLARIHKIRPRRHRCAVQAGHEDAIQILVRGTALEAGAIHKVVRLDGISVIVA